MTMRDVRLAQLRVLLKEEKEHRAKLAERIGKSPSQLSQWLSGYRTITEETARDIERRAGKPARWLDGEQEADKGSAPAVAQDLIPREIRVPPKISWGDAMTSSNLPPQFVVDMPDDALAPIVNRGTGMIFSCVAQPSPGLGVMVQDAGGRRYIRRYAEGPAGTWQAQAINSSYATLDSQRDGLTVLAVLTGRLDGTI